MTDDISGKLRLLVDQSEILECLHRCARGMDRHDAEMIASAYHSDAIDDHGGFSGSPAEFVEYVNGSSAGPGVHEQLFTDHMHYLSNHSADIVGDTAHTETYYIMVGRYRDNDRAGIWTGRYVDKLERRNGEWKISVRRVVMGATSVDFSCMPTAVATAEALFARPTWDRNDVSYQRPLAVPTRR